MDQLPHVRADCSVYPQELTAEEWWYRIKVSRRSTFRTLPLLDTSHAPFVYGTPDEVLELVHRIDKLASGQMLISDLDGNITVHVPPSATELVERLEAMCRFANGPDDGDPFIPPVVRSILLHFWLAHDHPFEDGNGRTARALFYWSMKRQGFWITEYLSISRILRDTPIQYSKSFLFTESDGGDAT